MRTRFRRATTVVATGMLATMLATATTASAATTEVTQTITSGQLEGVIVGTRLSSLDYSHGGSFSTGSMDLRIDDSTGSDAGWHVTVQSSDFVHGGTGPSIPATGFSLNWTTAPILSFEPNHQNPFDHDPGQDIGDGGPHAGTSFGSLDQARVVSSADAGYGKGRYQQDLNVSLQVPGQSLAGSYRATVTTTAISGPQDPGV